jgi:hypothetical protein
MSLTASDILHDADAYRRAYPDFGRTVLLNGATVDEDYRDSQADYDAGDPEDLDD